jgi:tripartite-type tricarboxylate transporter receptor subunit TctC
MGVELFAAAAHTGRALPFRELLYREITKAVALPDVQARMAMIGFEPVSVTPDDLAARIRMEAPKWEKIIRAANIKPEE